VQAARQALSARRWAAIETMTVGKETGSVQPTRAVIGRSVSPSVRGPSEVNFVRGRRRADCGPAHYVRRIASDLC